jgi:outer membrane lipoprotein-sorting protein
MPIFTSRPAARWLVPGAIVVAVVGGSALVRTMSASAEPALADRTAAQLLVDVQTAKLNGMSGTVRTTADLGLPQLPIPSGQGSADFSSLVSGSRTLRVWYAGPDKARVALLGTLGESDLIRNGHDVWAWDSRTQSATHKVLSDSESATKPEDVLPSNPQDAAAQALKAIDPSTIVSTGSNASVAGRSAYELKLAPRDTTSLVAEVRLAIDATEHVPLRVQVFARGGGDPAYEVAFTQVSFNRPDDAQFVFNPPPGTKVDESGPAAAKTPDASKAPEQGTGKTPAQGAASDTKVVGTGWTSVVVTRAPAPSAAPSTDPSGGTRARPNASDPMALLKSLPRVSGDWGGGTLLKSRLFSVLLLDDGRVLAGAVAPERLYEVARG